MLRSLDWRLAWPRLAQISPALVVALALALYLGLVLARAGGDPLALARLGEGFVNGQPVGDEGYDGQFVYWIAMDPRPAAAAPHLDAPAYRYQRILYPLLARALALGQPGLVPWTLALVNAAAHIAGTWLVDRWLRAHGLSRWYALAYGLWVGLVMPVRLDLTEPLCCALVAGAMLARLRGRGWLAAALLALALFAKETALVFAAALIAAEVLGRAPRQAAAYALALVPFALFQALLWMWFGSVGLASGGYMATPFEVVPYMGLWRIALVSVPAFLLLAAIFGPLVVFPSVWGLVAAARRVWVRDVAPPVLALGANAALIAVAPFSTFREPLGLVRLAAGLVLATVLFGAHVRSRRVLNYSLLWVAGLALAVRE